MAWPNFFCAFNKKNRKIYIKDAFVSFFCSIGLFSLYSSIGTLLTIHHTSFIKSSTFYVPRINSHIPLFNILSDAAEDTILFMLIIVGIVYVYNRLTAQSGRSKILILSIIALPFILPAEPEILDFAMRILLFGSLLMLVRYFWRFNPISFLFGAFCVETLPNIINYFSTIQDPSYKNQVFVAIFCIAMFFLYFLKEVFSAPKAAD